jgi:hypothetical protein
LELAVGLTTWPGWHGAAATWPQRLGRMWSVAGQAEARDHVGRRAVGEVRALTAAPALVTATPGHGAAVVLVARPNMFYLLAVTAP